MAGSRKKRTGARRKKSRTAPKVPAKLWLAAGVAISALAFGLHSLLPHINERPDAVAASGNTAVAKKVRKPQPKEPVFDFYTLLPESEVLTSGDKLAPAKPKPQPSQGKPKPAVSQTVGKKPAVSKPVQNEPPVVSAVDSHGREMAAPESENVKDISTVKGREEFLLQAGSFRSSQDAERLRVRLILSGYDARIAKVTVRGSEQWHRVQVGPYSSRKAVDKAKSTLASQGLNTMLLRQH